MYYRRKVILALFQVFQKKLEKTRLQKLLFLFSQMKRNPEYHFIPYKFGCYSFSASADISTMVKKGIIEEGEYEFVKNDNVDYFKLLQTEDKNLLLKVREQYGTMSLQTLIRHTYLNFPYYAINSTILNDCDISIIEKVRKERPEELETILFTIGYEGISLEEYLNKLVKNNIKALVDVRRNPLSMKYGFSKSLLTKFCNLLNIQYYHIPELGIASEYRQELIDQKDYDNLFDDYKKNCLEVNLKEQFLLISLLNTNKRIALTCFEQNICQCHRKSLSESICTLSQEKIQLRHI